MRWGITMSDRNAIHQKSHKVSNPADIKALYAWLGSPEIQYRDFSGERAVHRARLMEGELPVENETAADSSTQSLSATGKKVRRTYTRKNRLIVAGRAELWMAAAALIPVVGLLLVMAALPLSPLQQTVFAALLFSLALWLDRSSNTYRMTLLLICMSSFVTIRYAIWRSSSLASFFRNPTSHWSLLDALFMLSLFGSELYAFLVMFLGYLQMAMPLRRKPAPLPNDTDAWPHVDVLIPTYNEPLEVVRYTALAAANMDWPPEKMHVYILDDGRREDYRQFAQDAGIGYIARTDNRHAKAGNINHALTLIDSPYVAIFDCDHAPTRSFLQMTLGWFLRDAKMGLVQTPHHFYSPDPFERNLQQFRTMPNEGELFYGIIQDCNDFWNATFFCGSCAVLRRAVLKQIGGIATETITEDAHTSLRMQIAGWNTAYINIPQAAGLASERLSGHVKQRIRWARGMIQILRTENPLTAPRLTISQRLCYFNAMLYFLYALPRLIFLTAPLIYLLLGYVNIPGGWELILAYAMPHLALTSLTNSRIQGKHRHSFWNEVYEAVLAPYILLPTLLALINPKLGKFQVTDKGGVVEEAYFDRRIAQPFLALFLLNVLGLVMGPVDYLYRDPGHLGTVVMNCLWAVFNIIILGVAMAVAYESQQRRHNVRIAIQVPVRVQTSGGQIATGMTQDLSGGGSAILMDAEHPLPRGETISIVLPAPSGDVVLPARVMVARGRRLRIRFANLNIFDQEKLTMVLFSRADAWLGWGESRNPDHPLRSLALIARLSALGIFYTLRHIFRLPEHLPQRKRQPITVVSMMMLIACLLTGMSASVRPVSATEGKSEKAFSGAEVVGTPTPGTQTGENAESRFDRRFTLKDIGLQKSIVLRGLDSTDTVSFTLPQTEVAQTAILRLHYRFSPGLIPALSHLNVMMNGSLFAAIPMERGAPDEQFEATLTIPAELLVHANQLSFEFIGHYSNGYEDPANTTLWVQIDAASSIEISGDRLPLENDLKLLPVPFYDPDLVVEQTVPIVFLTQPSQTALEAAGVAASWIGVLADNHRVRFPVSIGNIPRGNAIVIAEQGGNVVRALGLVDISGPTIAMRTNPGDPYGKVLILAGQNAQQVRDAAVAMVLNPNTMSGDRVQTTVRLPDARMPDDAPRWLQTGVRTQFKDLTTDVLESDGSAPMNIYLRLPPDLYSGRQKDIPLYLRYRYNPAPLSAGSSINVLANEGYIGSVPLPGGNRIVREQAAFIGLPILKLHSFSNTLNAIFYFQLQKTGISKESAPISQRGAILPSSYVDLRGLYHWVAMPNLRLFATAGFPFTRMADLGETAVILPNRPSTEEITLYLEMLGRFGAATGYPALRVTVGAPETLGAVPDRDYLILGTMQDQSALRLLGTVLPVTVAGDGLRVEDTASIFTPIRNAWWRVQGWYRPESGDMLTKSSLPDALMEEIESPFAPGRSVLVIVTRDHAEMAQLMTSLEQAALTGTVAKSVSVMRGNEFASYRLGNKIYHVGRLPYWIRWSLWYAQFPYVAALLVMGICFVMAIWLQAMLRRRAQARMYWMESEEK